MKNLLSMNSMNSNKEIQLREGHNLVSALTDDRTERFQSARGLA